MQKTYVLDTNVLIQAPYALNSFEDNHLVLPLAVLEELDGLKNAEGERGANARQAIRYLESVSYTHLDVYKRQLINRDILTVRDSYKKILKNLCCFYR